MRNALILIVLADVLLAHFITLPNHGSRIMCSKKGHRATGSRLFQGAMPYSMRWGRAWIRQPPVAAAASLGDDEFSLTALQDETEEQEKETAPSEEGEAKNVEADASVVDNIENIAKHASGSSEGEDSNLIAQSSSLSSSSPSPSSSSSSSPLAEATSSSPIPAETTKGITNPDSPPSLFDEGLSASAPKFNFKRFPSAPPPKSSSPQKSPGHSSSRQSWSPQSPNSMQQRPSTTQARAQRYAKHFSPPPNGMTVPPEARQYGGVQQRFNGRRQSMPTHTYSSQGASSATLASKRRKNGGVYASWKVFKGKGAMNVVLRPPAWEAGVGSAVFMEKEGGLLLEFAPSVSQRVYDWQSKSSFCLNVGEMGSILALPAGDSAEFFHDPNKGKGATAQEGQVSKILRLQPANAQNSRDVFMSLDIRQQGQSSSRVMVPLSPGEFAVLKEIIRYSIPRSLGCDQVMEAAFFQSG